MVCKNGLHGAWRGTVWVVTKCDHQPIPVQVVR